MLLLPQYNLILQILILAIILVGGIFAKRKRLIIHERLMIIALILNVLSLLLIMGRSFASIVSLISIEISVVFTVVLVHGIIGSAAEALGIILVFKKFGNVKNIMRLTFILWIIAMLLGIASYWYFYLA